jgi:hypothetical protein
MLARGPARNYQPNDVMQVMLIALGPNVALYLDGEQLGVTRTEMTRPGGLGFSVANTGDPMVAYRFDNVRLWSLLPPDKSPEARPEVLISEDFEDGQADGWELEPGWRVIQEEDGNHALLGEKHSWARLKGDKRGDIHLRFRVKRIDGELIVNVRADPADPGRTRYLAHFMPDVIVLHRNSDGQGKVVADRPIAYTADRWHDVDLVARGGFIEILLDNQTVLTYEDPEPLPPGIVVFENGAPPARHLVDEVVIEPAAP